MGRTVAAAAGRDNSKGAGRARDFPAAERRGRGGGKRVGVNALRVGERQLLASARLRALTMALIEASSMLVSVPAP